MVNLAVQHSMQGLSGLAKDRFVNVFHVSTVGNADAALYQFISTTVRQFFAQDGAGVNEGVISWLANEVNGLGSTCKIYDMGLPLKSPPVFSESFTMPATTQMPQMPSEVAAVITLECDPVPGVPKARLRGRTYVGPLNTRGAGGGVPGAVGPRPNDAFLTVLRTRMANMINTLKTHNPVVRLQVYSPTIAKTNPAQAFHPVTSVSTDDAWDIQRRRGIQPTKRDRLATPL